MVQVIRRFLNHPNASYSWIEQARIKLNETRQPADGTKIFETLNTNQASRYDIFLRINKRISIS